MISTAPDRSSHLLNDAAFNVLFREARTYSAWLKRPVEDNLLHQLYDLMKWGPTSANCCPVRILFLRTRLSKERLRPALSPGNVDKTMKAPVTAIIAYDSKFYEQLPRLFPAMPAMKDMFVQSSELAGTTALRNGSLQGAYFIRNGFDTPQLAAAWFGLEAA